MATYPLHVQKQITDLRNKFVNSGEISLKDRDLLKVNKCHSPEQKTILMMAVELEKKEDVEFLLRIKNLDVNTRNKKDDTAADISWSLKNYDILLILLQNDSVFPKKFSMDKVDTEGAGKDELKRFVEERERFHEWIRDDKLEAIDEYTKNHKPFNFYSTSNDSALSRAIQYKRKTICSHLSTNILNFEVPETVINERKWIKDPVRSHIMKLVHVTRFLKKPDRKVWLAVIDMYLELDTHEEIRCLMKAIQYEDFEINFESLSEFANPDVDKTALGFTLPDGRIYIGGKGINKKEHYRKVHGTCAHEICHLAMLFIYERYNGQPYHHGDTKRKEEFRKICEDLYKRKDDKNMDKAIKEVYTLYEDKKKWESELIVRVPEILGTYGKETADKIFRKKISELYNYYSKYIIHDCNEFSKPYFHSKPLRDIKEISKYHGIVCGEDKSTSPFNENFLENNKYKDYLIEIEKYTNCKVWYCTTSNPKLCAMHIFHEQKQERKLRFHAEKRCLAFNLECCSTEKYYKEILEALKWKICTTLILLMTEKESAWEDKIKDLNKKLTKEKQVIIVTLTDICKELPESKKLNYQWNDLSQNSKKALLKKSVKYQGKSISLKDVVEYCKDTQVINQDVLWHIMSEDKLSIGKDISSNGNEGEWYIDRTFVRSVYKEHKFQAEQMPPHYLFMTGVEQSELPGNLKKWSRIIPNAHYEIENGKYVFVAKNEKNYSDLFKKLCSKIENKSKQVFWIHYTNGKYLLREPLERSEDNENHFEEEKFVEDKMLEETDGMMEVLIADDPGAGKSTSINSLMRKIESEYPEKLILRVNFIEHWHEFAASPSSQSLIEFLQRIFNMNNPLEKMAFKSLINIHKRVVLFFDGFDEMSKTIQRKAIESLQLLREHTQIQMWIFTRKQERLILEEKMNIVSFSLKQFSDDDQCNYFNLYWKSLLISLKHKNEDFENTFQEILNNLENYSGKCERLLKSMKELVNIPKENQEEIIKKINDLDFSDYSKLVVNSVKDIILKGEFIVPLWLSMMADIIVYSKFKIPDNRNRYAFYRNFMEKKVDYYLTKKCNLSSGVADQDFYSRKKKILKSLRKFSVKVMRSKHYEEILDPKKYDLKDKDQRELVRVGLLRTEGEEYHFFHKTFAEFLFSEMFVEEIESVNAKLLSDVLLEDSYREVRIFLDGYLEKSESQSLVDDVLEKDFIEKKKSFDFPIDLLQEFKLFKIYSEFCETIKDRTGYWIWNRIFISCEKQMKESVGEKSILQVLNFSPFKGKYYDLNGVLDVLNSTFTDNMLFIMFDSLVDDSNMFLFICLKCIKSNDLNAMISIFKKILNYKESKLRSEVPSTANSLENVKVGLEIFQKEYKDEDGNSILHLVTENRKGRVLDDLREIESMIENGQFNKLLTIQNKDGRTMLHVLMEYSEDPEEVTAVLECVKEVMEGDLFKQFLLQKDNEGIFPISCANLRIMKDVLELMGSYFIYPYIIVMLLYNEVHLGESIVITDCAIKEILYLEEYLGIENFKEIIISRNILEETRLHRLLEREHEQNREREKLIVSDLKEYARLLDSMRLYCFLFSQDIRGNTFLHNWALYASQYTDILRELHTILSPDAFEFLLNIRNGRKQSFIHFYYNYPLSEISFLVEFLGKENLMKLLIARDIEGKTQLHYVRKINKDKDLKFYSEVLDKDSFRDLEQETRNVSSVFDMTFEEFVSLLTEDTPRPVQL